LINFWIFTAKHFLSGFPVPFFERFQSIFPNSFDLYSARFLWSIRYFLFNLFTYGRVYSITSFTSFHRVTLLIILMLKVILTWSSIASIICYQLINFWIFTANHFFSSNQVFFSERFQSIFPYSFDLYSARFHFTSLVLFQKFFSIFCNLGDSVEVVITNCLCLKVILTWVEHLLLGPGYAAATDCDLLLRPGPSRQALLQLHQVPAVPQLLDSRAIEVYVGGGEARREADWPKQGGGGRVSEHAVTLALTPVRGGGALRTGRHLLAGQHGPELRSFAARIQARQGKRGLGGLGVLGGRVGQNWRGENVWWSTALCGLPRWGGKE